MRGASVQRFASRRRPPSDIKWALAGCGAPPRVPHVVQELPHRISLAQLLLLGFPAAFLCGFSDHLLGVCEEFLSASLLPLDLACFCRAPFIAQQSLRSVGLRRRPGLSRASASLSSRPPAINGATLPDPDLARTPARPSTDRHRGWSSPHHLDEDLSERSFVRILLELHRRLVEAFEGSFRKPLLDCEVLPGGRRSSPARFPKLAQQSRLLPKRKPARLELAKQGRREQGRQTHQRAGYECDSGGIAVVRAWMKRRTRSSAITTSGRLSAFSSSSHAPL